MQFSSFFKLKQYQFFPAILMHVEKQCSSPLSQFELMDTGRQDVSLMVYDALNSWAQETTLMLVIPFAHLSCNRA